MNLHQQATLASIDSKCKDIITLIMQGVDSGIPKNIMDAHVRAYFKKHLGRHLIKLHTECPQLFPDFIL